LDGKGGMRVSNGINFIAFVHGQAYNNPGVVLIKGSPSLRTKVGGSKTMGGGPQPDLVTDTL
jgi:hypothetical protein